MRNVFVWILTILILTSCNDDVRNTFTPKPVALGRLNDVVAISDKTLWESAAGDKFRYLYESAYPVMPTPEPLFDIRHFTTNDLAAEPLRRELRTYVILANLGDKESQTTKMVRRDLGEERFKKAMRDTTYFSSAGRDKWAREQLVAYVFGKDVDDLTRAIEKSFPGIANKIKKHDQLQLASNVYNLKNHDLETKRALRENFGVEISIPGDYKKKVESDNNFMMLKRDFKDYAQSIVVRRFPYVNQDQLSKDGIIKMRNDYGREFISGLSQNSYMRTNNNDLPVYEYSTEINGAYVKEVRGVWELANDFIGGPFITYVFLDKNKNEIVFIDTFVYAPSRSKRDLVQQLEHIVLTTKLIGTPSE